MGNNTSRYWIKCDECGEKLGVEVDNGYPQTRDSPEEGPTIDKVDDCKCGHVMDEEVVWEKVAEASNDDR